MFLNHKTEIVSPDEFNQIIKDLKYKRVIYKKPNFADGKKNFFSRFLYIWEGRSSVNCATFFTKKNKVIEYRAYLDGREAFNRITGLQAFRVFSTYHKIPKFEKPVFSAGPLIDYNRKYNNTRQQAWGYDLNSAYARAMTTMWIDTSVAPKRGKIGENEIGFDYDDDDKVIMKYKGYSNFIFKIVPVPQGVKNFVNRYYTMKKNAKDKKEKQKAKDMLNFTVGWFQRTNCFLRAMIVCNMNNYIESLIDENTLFWNTDSIVSRVRRPDLEANMGNEIGQWKLEHEGVVAYRDNVYQWNDSKPSYRGIEKSRFYENYDLLTDSRPPINNLYYFNRETKQIEEAL